jgi:hypothetical protein
VFARRDMWEPDASADSRADPESAVAEPPSDGSSGICTFNRGRLAPTWDMPLFVLGGGGNSDIDEVETFLFLLCAMWVAARDGGGGGEGPVVAPLVRETAPTSTD